MEILLALLAVVLVVLTGYVLKLTQQASFLKQEYENLKALYQDATEDYVKNNNELLTEESLDFVTGLPVSFVFEDRLKQALLQSKRHQTLIGVMSLEIDHFNELTKFGQESTDKLLKEFANRLQMSIRQVDSVARTTGRSFLFLLPYLTRAETATYVAQRIQDNLIQAFKIDGHEILLTVSIGIVIFPVDGNDKDTLLVKANEALQQARESGGNKYQYFQPELHQRGQREINLSNLIRSEELFTRLRIRYKPYFHFESHKPVYIQASPHIYEPHYGMIPYSQFVTLAENAGKMLEINEWVIKNAIDKIRQWRREGFKPEQLSISVSLRQLENPHFVYRIIEVVNELKQDSVQFVLEISDQQFTQNPQFIEKLFSTFEKEKIRVAVGVIALGHFALQKIRGIPLHYLKIDSRLVHEVEAHPEKEHILSKIIELARDEKITVMADGVDTDKIKARMKKLGCKIMEGKLFGYLMPTGSVLEKEV